MQSQLTCYHAESDMIIHACTLYLLKHHRDTITFCNIFTDGPCHTSPMAGHRMLGGRWGNRGTLVGVPRIQVRSRVEELPDWIWSRSAGIGWYVRCSRQPRHPTVRICEDLRVRSMVFDWWHLRWRGGWNASMMEENKMHCNCVTCHILVNNCKLSGHRHITYGGYACTHALCFFSLAPFVLNLKVRSVLRRYSTAPRTQSITNYKSAHATSTTPAACDMVLAAFHIPPDLCTVDTHICGM